ncbi:MAG: helicase [Rhodobiaceae bacterium]|nr:helicase [Rhodobiaceae bacterium]
MPDISAHPAARARGVTAVLGPTNTGKTHLAIERMLGHASGVIGLPLRLLAREVYDRVVERAGAEAVALVTGEERIKPDNPRYWVATVEAMPRDIDPAFLAVDEVQLAADLDRGHIFTDRILSARGREETLLLGSHTMQPILERLLPGLNVIRRPRFSQLTYAGERKLTRLPRRSAIVAFSAEEVYAIAELIRRQRGGAAVVMGALSPRTRNAQVEMYQAGEVDFLIATDAIGMGLNLDVDHIAFASTRKFDGFQRRDLTAAEMAQIAGRAGRHMRDGTFGVSGRAPAPEPDIVQRIEAHEFPHVELLQWRSTRLDFSTLAALRASLDVPPTEAGLVRAPLRDDVLALDHASRDATVGALATSREAVERLWSVCQVPDYRKIAPANHGDLISDIYRHLMADGRIPDEWFAEQVAFCDRSDGDIDAIANRISHIRTWTFIANREDWLADPVHWQETTRAIEDKLSDLLHERLTQRFVDRKTGALTRRLRENGSLDAVIGDNGRVDVEGHHVGMLSGFRFVLAPGDAGADQKALRRAAMRALETELNDRAQQLAAATDSEFALNGAAQITWRGEPVARLAPGDRLLAPAILPLLDEQVPTPHREQIAERLKRFLDAKLRETFKPLFEIAEDEGLTGPARGVGFQLVEALGVLERAPLADILRDLDQPSRALLRRHGVRFGAHHVFLPVLMKPAPRKLAAELWALGRPEGEISALRQIAALAFSGRTSIDAVAGAPEAAYPLMGFRLTGPRAIRIDILERLADLIRAATSYKPGDAIVPEGAVDGRTFTTTLAMMSLAGAAGDEFAALMKGLGYQPQKRKADTLPAAASTAGVAESEGAPSADTPTVPAAEDQSAGVVEAAEISAPEAEPAEVAAAPADAAPAHSDPLIDEEGNVTVWELPRRGARPGRAPQRDRDGQGEGRRDGDKRPGRGKPARHGKQNGKPERSGFKPQKPAREKPVDPNSPFAALAGLRDKLNDKKDR